MKKVYYFAYGSNLYKDRLDRRVYGTKPTKVCNYKLMGWRLIFNAESAGVDTTYANIEVGDPDDFVEGVLYNITADQFKTLDNFEMLYERYFFDVDADTLGCVYICTKDWQLGQKYTPDLSYLNTVLCGALEHNLKTVVQKMRYLIEHIDFTKTKRSRTFNNY